MSGCKTQKTAHRRLIHGWTDGAERRRVSELIPMTPERRCGTPTDVSDVMVIHRRFLLSAMRSNYDSGISRCCPSNSNIFQSTQSHRGSISTVSCDNFRPEVVSDVISDVAVEWVGLNVKCHSRTRCFSAITTTLLFSEFAVE